MPRKEVSSYTDNSAGYSMSVFRGDTLTFDISVDGVEDAMAESLFFSVKADTADDDYVIQKSLDDGIAEISEEGELRFRVRVSPGEMALIEPGVYIYDIQLGLGADIYTICSGDLTVKEDVTR